MNEQHVPERRLSDEARARRRTELMAAVRADERQPRRWVAPVAAAAVVAGLVGGGYAVGRTGDDEPASTNLDVAGSGNASTASTDPSGAPSPSSSEDPEPECEATTLSPEQEMRERMEDPLWEDPVIAPVLQSYRDVLVRHLDPQDEHLERKPSNVQTSGIPGCDFDALGTKLGWSVPGEGGLGMVQIEVGTSARGSQVELSFGGWRQVDEPRLPDGVTRAREVHNGDVTAVLVVRDDGVAVGIIADPLFGNNSTTGVTGFGFGVADLLAAAADPALALPQ